ncbi:MAG: hypothetical protein AAFW73_08965 [Bacteroidota bacterium]
MSDTPLLGIGSRVKHPAFGAGVVIRLRAVAYEICFMQYGIKEVGKNYQNLEVIEHIPPRESVSFSEAEKSLIRILRTWSDITEEIPLGDRWQDGKLIIQSADAAIKSKEIPIETFFHKIVMVRDRLRVMEQRINASKNLSDEEKVNLQQYITRIYGSLTTFNVLFKYKEDSFVGEKSN